MVAVYISLAVVVIVAVLIVYQTIVTKLKKEINNLKEQIGELKNALESKKEADKKREEDKTEPGRQDQDYFINNLVTKTTKTRMGRTLAEYKINKEKMPKFKTREESIGFGLGLVNENTDPTILNLSPYGCVMKSDDFFAFKIVMQDIFFQLRELS